MIDTLKTKLQSKELEFKHTRDDLFAELKLKEAELAKIMSQTRSLRDQATLVRNQHQLDSESNLNSQERYNSLYEVYLKLHDRHNRLTQDVKSFKGTN